jgi:putative flippase GtrA
VAARLAALAPTLVQLSRYSAASVMALALDFTVYLLLTAGEMKPVLAGVLGYGAGLLLHFVLSSRFVFVAAAAKAQARRFGEFALSGLAGIGTTATVMTLATDFAGLPGLTAKVLAAGASFLLVYWLRCSIVFAGPPNSINVLAQKTGTPRSGAFSRR